VFMYGSRKGQKKGPCLPLSPLSSCTKRGKDSKPRSLYRIYPVRKEEEGGKGSADGNFGKVQEDLSFHGRDEKPAYGV